MKAKKKAKSPAKGTNRRLPIGLQKTRVVRRPREDEPQDNTFSEMETGQPDATPFPDSENPAGAQGGRGPLNQEGEGDRQNSALAELEMIEPDITEK